MIQIMFFCTTQRFFSYNRAENETKAKLEKVAEIKKVNAAMMAIKSEISKYEDTLKEYQMYRKFLDNLTPQVCISLFNTKGKNFKKKINILHMRFMNLYPFPD